MARDRCPREDETIRAAWDAARSLESAHTCGARLPARDPEVSAHIAECPSCAEIVALAAALRQERKDACAEAHPPAAGIVWWRAERRAREEAARRAATPISFVHAIALGCAGAALVAILGFGAGSVRHGVAQWWDGLRWPAAPGGILVGVLSALPIGVVVLMLATLLLAPVAVYLALSEK
jgi:hypothetical protein